ncbi:MAG: SRPBCC family protein [Chloroflexi bacterium]|nr:SRPBCC family protein [Chloroflexota bacterium]
MPKIEEKIVIAAPLDQVWTLMRDTGRRPEWDLSVRSVRRVESGDPADTRFYYVAPLALGLTWRWEGRYAVFHDHRRAAVQLISGSALRPFRKLAGTWLLNPVDGGALLTMNVNFEPRMSWLAPLMAWRVRRVLRQSLVRFKALAESEAVPAPKERNAEGRLVAPDG